jgi:hypothetical protein
LAQKSFTKQAQKVSMVALLMIAQAAGGGGRGEGYYPSPFPFINPLNPLGFEIRLRKTRNPILRKMLDPAVKPIRIEGSYSQKFARMIFLENCNSEHSLEELL